MVNDLVILNEVTIAVPGDVNRDSAVSFLDITPFILVLSTGRFQSEADINDDGAVNFLDITPFILVLSSQ